MRSIFGWFSLFASIMTWVVGLLMGFGGCGWLCLVLRLGCLFAFVFSAEFWLDFFLFLLCGSLSCLSIASSILAVKMLCEFCRGGVDDIDHTREGDEIGIGKRKRKKDDNRSDSKFVLDRCL